MSLQSDAQAALEAVQAVVDDVNSDVADPNDAVVASMVSALESAGYTVTPPAPELPAGSPAS